MQLERGDDLDCRPLTHWPDQDPLQDILACCDPARLELEACVGRDDVEGARGILRRAGVLDAADHFTDGTPWAGTPLDELRSDPRYIAKLVANGAYASVHALSAERRGIEIVYVYVADEVGERRELARTLRPVSARRLIDMADDTAIAGELRSMAGNFPIEELAGLWLWEPETYPAFTQYFVTEEAEWIEELREEWMLDDEDDEEE